MGKEKSSGIFANWLQNFSTIVFTQSFHAVYLMFIMKFLSQLSIGGLDASEGGNFAQKQGIFAIVSIAGLWGLIKLEKLIKSTFGIKDSKLLGGIGENFTKAMVGMKSGMALAQRTKEPFTKANEAKKTVAAKQKAYDTAVRRNAAINAASAEDSAESSTASGAYNTGNQTNNTVLQGDNIAGNNNLPGSGNGQGIGNGANVGLTNEALNKLIMALENNAAALQKSGAGGSSGGSNAAARFDAEEAEQNAYEELEKAKRDAEIAKRQRVTRLATTVGAAAMGMGATDNLGDAVTAANLIDMPLDYITDRKIQRNVNLEQSKRVMDERNATIEELNKAQERASKISASKNRASNNGTRQLSQNVANRYREFEAENARTQAKLTKQAERQAAMAQEFLDDMPKSMLASMGKAWAEMAEQSTPIKITKKETGGYAPTLNTTFNRGLRTEVREAKRSIQNVNDRLHRRPVQPRSVDEL